MTMDIRDHPEAPPVEELAELTMVPIDPAEIEAKLAQGVELQEYDLRENRDDVYVELEPDPLETGYGDDIGTALYRLTQLFGTPNVPGYEAGSDVSDREDTTFKYLFRVEAGEYEGFEGDRQLPDSWLVTVYDWHVDLGVSTAAWGDDDHDPTGYGDDVALVSLALATNVVTEPVECEYKDVWY